MLGSLKGYWRVWVPPTPELRPTTTRMRDASEPVLLDHGLTGLQTKNIITIVMHDENPNNNTKNNNNNDEKKLCRVAVSSLDS